MNGVQKSRVFLSLTIINVHGKSGYRCRRRLCETGLGTTCGWCEKGVSTGGEPWRSWRTRSGVTSSNGAGSRNWRRLGNDATLRCQDWRVAEVKFMMKSALDQQQWVGGRLFRNNLAGQWVAWRMMMMSMTISQDSESPGEWCQWRSRRCGSESPNGEEKWKSLDRTVSRLEDEKKYWSRRGNA